MFLSFSKNSQIKFLKSVDLIKIRKGNTQKNLVFQLNWSLLGGTASATLDKGSSNLINYKPCIKYMWYKRLHSRILSNLSYIFSSLLKATHSQKINKTMLESIQYNEFPVFTLVNKFNQIIISELTTNSTLIPKSFLAKIYDWCLFQLNYSTNTKYKSWFFVNSEDAQEFAQYISKRYTESTKEHGLNVVPVNLSMYYRMSRTLYPQIEFRLIPDLNEIAKLVDKYKYYKNVYFYRNQKHNSDYFKGQPIYIIRPVDQMTKDKNLLEYSSNHYTIRLNPENMQYKTIFTNYNIASKVLKKLNFHLKDHSINTKNKIMVYNLEDFLNDINCNSTMQRKNFEIIPPKCSYEFIKNREQNLSCSLSNISIYLSHIKLWTKRIISSLVSNKPISI